MSNNKDVEINEAPKGSPARPKSYSDTMVKASRDAAKRAPGATPSWLTKAIKAKKTNEEVEQVDEAKMNPSQKDAVKGALKLRSDIGMKSPTSAVKKIIKFVKNEEVDHSTFAKQYRDNESDNRHSENVVLMAKHFGSKEDQEKSKDILKRHKQIGHLPQDLATERLKIVKKLWPKASSHLDEEVDLDEARGRPPKVGSKAWHAKQAAVKSGEGEEQESDKNIVNQMRKKPVGEHHSLTFNNGEKKQVHAQHVNKALSLLANTPKPADREKIQKSLAHSHDRFMATIKSGKAVEDAARPKVSLGKMKAESVDPITTRADRGAIVVRRIRKPDGSYVVTSTKKGRTHTGDIIDANEAFGYYDVSKSEGAEEKKEGQKAPKGSSDDMTKDSSDRMQSMSPQAFKKKFVLPPTVGNTSTGGEDTTYAQGKYSVAEEEILNKLYANLSEENKDIFNNLIETEDGIDQLLKFAEDQGY